MIETVGLISLGCAKNLVDSEIMLGILEKAGYLLVTEPRDADILIINTCSFINDAKKESVDTILEMGQFKKGGRTKYLVVTGCLPQRYKKDISKLFPEVDLFIGTGEYQNIAKLIKQLDDGAVTTREYIGIPRYIHNAGTPRKIASVPHSVYIKIAEGCFHACSFCAIPKMRGAYRSRPLSDVVCEAKNLIRAGAKELNIIAQDTTAYGRDLKKGDDLVRLLGKIAKIEEKKWIRLLYTYPQSFDERILPLMKEEESICRYIDIPIQHIDNDILYDMKRGRSGDDIRRLITYIKDTLPDVSLRTSIITGFPGETARQHKKLLKFIEEGWFDNVGVFTYSREEGTHAALMKGNVPSRVKNERHRQLMEAQRYVSRRNLAKKVGESVEVLIDGRQEGKDAKFIGHTPFQAPEIDGVVYIAVPHIKTGHFYSVEITGADDYDLVGEVV